MQYHNFKSHHPLHQKLGVVIRTLLDECNKITRILPRGGYSTLVWVGLCLWGFWSATTHHPSMYQFWRKSDPSMYHGIWGQAHPCTTVYNFWPPIHVPVGKIHPWRYQNKAKITTHRGTSKKFRPMHVPTRIHCEIKETWQTWADWAIEI